MADNDPPHEEEVHDPDRYHVPFEDLEVDEVLSLYLYRRRGSPFRPSTPSPPASPQQQQQQPPPPPHPQLPPPPPQQQLVPPQQHQPRPQGPAAYHSSSAAVYGVHQGSAPPLQRSSPSLPASTPLLPPPPPPQHQAPRPQGTGAYPSSYAAVYGVQQGSAPPLLPSSLSLPASTPLLPPPPPPQHQAPRPQSPAAYPSSSAAVQQGSAPPLRPSSLSLPASTPLLPPPPPPQHQAPRPQSRSSAAAAAAGLRTLTYVPPSKAFEGQQTSSVTKHPRLMPKAPRGPPKVDIMNLADTNPPIRRRERLPMPGVHHEAAQEVPGALQEDIEEAISDDDVDEDADFNGPASPSTSGAEAEAAQQVVPGFVEEPRAIEEYLSDEDEKSAREARNRDAGEAVHLSGRGSPSRGDTGAQLLEFRQADSTKPPGYKAWSSGDNS